MQILNTLFFPDLFSDIWFRIKEVLFLIKSFALLPWCGFLSFFRIEIFVFCRFRSIEQLLSIISLFEFEFECDCDGNRCVEVERRVSWPRLFDFNFAVSPSYFEWCFGSITLSIDVALHLAPTHSRRINQRI